MSGLVLGQPVTGLRRPILLAGFSGWGDAGGAASIGLRHLLGEEPPAASAMIDPSACYDFTVARPISSKRDDGGWSLEYPKIAFHPVRLPDSERDVLVVVGPEPHFRWPEIAPAMITYARDSGVELLLTLGGFVGAVSHHHAPIVGRTLEPSLRQHLAADDVRESDYEGPTAFATALLHAGSAAGIPAASLWVATPPYLQAGNPVAALALLTAAARFTSMPLELPRLRETAATFLRDVDQALEEHPELAEQLKEMLESEELEDAGALDLTHDIQADLDRPPPDAPPGLPSGKALVEAVEQYLRIARKDEPPTAEH